MRVGVVGSGIAGLGAARALVAAGATRLGVSGSRAVLAGGAGPSAAGY